MGEPLKHVCVFPGCKKAFKKKWRLEEHICSHTGERPFACLECGATFIRKTHLQRHSKKHLDETERDTFPCTAAGCNTSFLTQHGLTRHLRSHDPNYLPYPCTWEGCAQKFRKKTALRKHMFEHTGIKPFTCPHVGCNERFITSGMVQRHVSSVHEAPQPLHHCEECGASFRLRSELKIHRKGKHPPLDKDTLTSCLDCDKMFSKPSNMRAHHKRVHQQLKPFACTQCSWKFAYRHVLERHLEKVHGVPRSKREREDEEEKVDEKKNRTA